MYSHLNIEIISSICDDKFWVSINHEEDGQTGQRADTETETALPCFTWGTCDGRKGPWVRSGQTCCYKSERSIEICHLTIIIPSNNMNKVNHIAI